VLNCLHPYGLEAVYALPWATQLITVSA
jgi:hypothetical protein